MSGKRYRQIGLILFWVTVTLLFLYERRYLIQKAGLGYFVECTTVRLILIVSLVYFNLYYLIPRFLYTRQILTYAALFLGAVAIYVVLQAWYDVYLYGFVLGNENSRDMFAIIPYVFLSMIWYLLISICIKLSFDWYEQRKELSELQQQISLTQNDTIVLKSGTKYIKTDLGSITHVEGLKDYSIIYSKEDKIVVKGNLKSVNELFPTGFFLRVHKSFLVVRSKIIQIEGSHILVKNNENIPIGRLYKKEVLRALSGPSDIPAKTA